MDMIGEPLGWERNEQL